MVQRGNTGVICLKARQDKVENRRNDKYRAGNKGPKISLLLLSSS